MSAISYAFTIQSSIVIVLNSFKQLVSIASAFTDKDFEPDEVVHSRAPCDQMGSLVSSIGAI